MFYFAVYNIWFDFSGNDIKENGLNPNQNPFKNLMLAKIEMAGILFIYTFVKVLFLWTTPATQLYGSVTALNPEDFENVEPQWGPKNYAQKLLSKKSEFLFKLSFVIYSC